MKPKPRRSRRAPGLLAGRIIAGVLAVAFGGLGLAGADANSPKEASGGGRGKWHTQRLKDEMTDATTTILTVDSEDLFRPSIGGPWRAKLVLRCGPEAGVFLAIVEPVLASNGLLLRFDSEEPATAAGEREASGAIHITDAFIGRDWIGTPGLWSKIQKSSRLRFRLSRAGGGFLESWFVVRGSARAVKASGCQEPQDPDE